MKRLLAIAILCAVPGCTFAQAVDATVCEILKAPKTFNGKIVRIKGTVEAGFDQFVIKGVDCGQKVNEIWLSYPEGTKAKSGPAAMLELQPAKNFAGTVAPVDRTPVQLDKNKDFKQFDSALATPFKGSGMCLGCGRYNVSATLVGRLDGVVPELKRDTSGKIIGISGFGNLNAYSARLVLQSVSDIQQQEIDYSKAPPLPKSDAALDSEAGAVLSHEFGPTSIPLADQPKRAIAAFGKPGEDNGVDVGGLLNEASAKDEAKSTNSSPDGVLFKCSFNFDRLKGDPLARAMAHLGEHIADLRNPGNGLESVGLYQLEYRAWITTMMNAIYSGQKSLLIPGGYTIWNSTWPTPSLNRNTNEALTGFLSNQELLAK